MNTGAISNPCGNDNGPAELKEAEKLIAPFFQVFDQTCIEFTDIKAGDVFTVQINHIAVGDAAAFRYLQTDKAAAPLHTQSALGVGNDIDLFTACSLYDGFDAFSQFFSTVGNGSGRLLAAIVDVSSVLFQLHGNSAPVIKESEVTEEDAVYQKKRIAGLTLPVLGSGFIEKVFFIFILYFRRSDTDNLT